MTELFDMDLATVDEVDSVEEAIVRLQAFIVETEFTPSLAQQVALIELGEEDGVEFLSNAMNESVVDEGLSDDSDEKEMGRETNVNVRCEAQRILDMVKVRKQQGLGTRLRDLVNDVESQAMVRRGMEAVRRQQAEQKLKMMQQENLQGPVEENSAAKTKGVFEYLLAASILTRKRCK